MAVKIEEIFLLDAPTVSKKVTTKETVKIRNRVLSFIEHRKKMVKKIDEGMLIPFEFGKIEVDDFMIDVRDRYIDDLFEYMHYAYKWGVNPSPVD